MSFLSALQNLILNTLDYIIPCTACNQCFSSIISDLICLYGRIYFEMGARLYILHLD